MSMISALNRENYFYLTLHLFFFLAFSDWIASFLQLTGGIEEDVYIPWLKVMVLFFKCIIKRTYNLPSQDIKKNFKVMVFQFMKNINSDIYIFRDLISLFLQWGHFFKGKTSAKLLSGKVSNFSQRQCFSVGTRRWFILLWEHRSFFLFIFKWTFPKPNPILESQ